MQLRERGTGNHVPPISHFPRRRRARRSRRPFQDPMEYIGQDLSCQVRVLIADDQRPTRLGLRALLELSPVIEVIGEAADGRGVVHLVAERQPDVVLMDIRMPIMDGLEATRIIKRQWPGVRVVALTMYSRYRARAFAVGADAFLLKGCTPRALQNAILAERQPVESIVEVPRGQRKDVG